MGAALDLILLLSGMPCDSFLRRPKTGIGLSTRTDHRRAIVAWTPTLKVGAWHTYVDQLLASQSRTLGC